MPRWMLYGANGYTGDITAREAVRRGHRPVLAGRNREQVEALARELGCEARVFDLDRIDLSGVDAVLHCAGPFAYTSAPMVQACLDAGVHYLDITGEIGVVEAVFARDEEARRRNVLLLPGVGFDVVPTDCLAAMLHARMPDANELWLAFHTRGGVSRGTMKTILDSIGDGGAIRRDGRIVRVPALFDVRTIPFESGPRTAAAIPWGDIATAYRSTGIPNIRVYRAASEGMIRRTRRFARVAPLLRFTPVKRLLQAYVGRTMTGPTAEQRASGNVELWGRVANARGEEATMTLRTGEGYDFTVRSSLAAVERVVAGLGKSGALTPSQAFGPDFVHNI